MPSGDDQSQVPESGTDDLRGRVVGDFKIIEEIGRGGMGVVYRAHQVSLDRIVALKILSNTAGLTESAIVRFQREAQAAAKLHHPHIVPIYAQGQHGRTYYYAMEYLSGRTLFDVIVQARKQHGVSAADLARKTDIALAETELIEVGSGAARSGGPSRTGVMRSQIDQVVAQIRDVADALEYAHQQGVIHRDIKPHNLLVESGNRLCVADFGLARVLQQPGLTVTGEFIGSPLYMSPEQVTGTQGQIDHRTDIYSLGATFYQWLTLEPPFPGETREQVISKIMTSDVLPPRMLSGEVPVDVETICLKALEKDPSRRYQRAAEFRDDLQRFLDRSHIKARRAGVLERIGKHISKRRVAATIVIAAFLVTVLSAELFRQRGEVKKTVEVAAKAVASKDEQVARILAENARLQEQAEQLGTLIDRTGEFGGEIAKMFQPAIEIAPSVAGLLLQAGEHSESYVPVTEAQRIGAMFYSTLLTAESERRRGTDPKRIEAGSAEEQYLKGLAARTAEEAVAHLDRCLVLDPEHFEARHLRAWAYCQASRASEMLADAEHLLRIAPQSGAGHVVRGAANLLLEHWSLSLADLNRASETLGDDNRIHVLRGLAHAQAGQPEAALGTLSQALIVDPDNILALMRRAALSFDGGYAPAAIVDLTHVLRLEPRNAEALELQGRCYEELEDFDRSYAVYIQAAQIAGSERLWRKVGMVVAKRNRQRKARRPAEEGEADSESSSSAQPVQPLSPQQINPQQWLEQFLDRRRDDTKERPLSRPQATLGWLS